MSTDVPARIHVVAVLFALTAALLARSWLQIVLRDNGLDALHAADASYLVVPPVLVLLLFPTLRKDWRFICSRLQFGGISLQVLVAALVIGLLLRIAWWSQLVARISFGWQENANPNAIEGPVLSYLCPAPWVVLLGILVGAILIPVVEEVIHRGYVQTLFHKRGPLIAVAVSTVLFTVFHRQSGWLFAFTGGAVLGTMYWLSGSLWPPIITHSVVNLTPQFTWRCMNLQWNPQSDALPLWSLGIRASIVFCLSAVTILWLVLAKCRRREY